MAIETLIDAMQDGVAVLDRAGVSVHANPALCRMTGLCMDDLLGAGPPYPYWPPEEQATNGAVVESYLRGEFADHELIFMRKDGTRFPVLVSPAFLRDGKGEIRYYVSTIKDITERRRREQVIRDSEARYRRVVEDQTEFVVRWQPDGKRTFVNDAYCRFFQQPREELVGTSFFPLVAEEDFERVRSRLRALTPGNPVSAGEHRVVCPDGGIAWQRWSDRAIFDDAGRLVEFQSVGLDITERKRAELALEERLGFQSLSADLSARLLEAPASGVNRQIELGLEWIGEHLALDRASIRWFDERRTAVRPIHQWLRPGTTPWPAARGVTDLPWIGPRARRGETLRVSRLEDLPPQAAADRKQLRALGIRSILVLPLVAGGDILGACVFAAERGECEWPDQLVVDLRNLSEIMASALVRARAEEELQAALTEVAHLKDQLQAENVYLREEIRLAHGFGEIVGESEGLRHCLHLVEQVAPTDSIVLILGETGTGKELVARAIHDLSSRKARPLVKVNCAALPSTLIESELFGHEKGAFTGADRRREGRFELADRGTLFLDEIADLPLELQGKLLRVLQEGEFERLGGTQTLRADVRVIAATNRDLEGAVAADEFRADLYYRLNVFPIRVPSLRERKEDIPLLVEHFARKHNQRMGRSVELISKRMLDRLAEHDWPGNLRELENAIERALIRSKGPVLDVEQPSAGSVDPVSGPPAVEDPRSTSLRKIERDHIVSVLDKAGWTIEGKSGAASMLGMPPSSLRSKMKRLGVTRPR